MRTNSDTLLTNPFVGLRAFEENEDYLFFGRSNQISELLKVLHASRFLAVIGSSGSGKSSLVKSGLLPAIYSGFMTVGSNWRAVTMRPGEDPIGYLTKALAAEDVLYRDVENSEVPLEWIIESSLRRSENGLVQVYKEARLPAHENLLIVVDQFEELFRFSRYEKENNLGKSDAIHFIQILLAAAQQKECPIYVLMTMRADFLGDCAEFRGLPEAINEGQYLIPRMKRDEIREAITGPVAVSGATISQRLVTRLLNDLNNDTDQLPILQHALMRTWDAWYQRHQPDSPIDFADYEKIGTMRMALSQHADEAYAELSPEKEQRICELMFKALTDKAADIRGIRRPRSIEDLCLLTGGSESQVKKVIEVFRRPGRTFLMPPPTITLSETSIIDISHESLMRIWTRLVNWIEEEARNGDIYLRLVNSAQLKEKGQRGLLKNPELEIALRWREQNKPTAKWAEGYKANFEQAMIYLDESQQEDHAEKEIKRKRVRNQRRLMVGFLVFLTGVAITLLFLTQQAKSAERKAEESAKIAVEERTKADIAAKVAVDSAKAAVVARNKADSTSNVADSVAKVAERNANDARKEKVAAEKATKEAQEATRKEAAAKKEVLDKNIALTEARKKALLSISRDYARLIREGPSEENENKARFYEKDYFLLYAHHFNNLKDSIAGEHKDNYNVIRDKLYYNNELYKRLHESLFKEPRRSNSKERETVLRSLSDPVVPREREMPVNDKGTYVYLKKTEGPGLLYIKNNNNKIDSATPENRGQKFMALTVSKKKNLVFCSTSDNYLYIYDDQLKKTGQISMGARVTALDCRDTNNRTIIYFGTSSGYIGYILYDGDKKNQPVFENKLESEITALQVFDRKQETFLLATAKESSPRVYKLNANSLQPDKLLWGNELPYERKEYGIISDGWYEEGRIKLVTQRAIYSWNPFTDELLPWLMRLRNPDPALFPELKLY